MTAATVTQLCTTDIEDHATRLRRSGMKKEVSKRVTAILFVIALCGSATTMAQCDGLDSTSPLSQIQILVSQNRLYEVKTKTMD
jgi:hypothetical protein